MNALTSPEVGKYIGEHFVSSFQKVATFRIVNGAKQGGNVAAYFCAPDGRVLHVIAGPVDAATLLGEAKWVVDSVRKAIEESKRTDRNFKAIFRTWHAERLRREHGFVVKPVTFDSPSDPDGPLTFRDPTGRPLVPVLPPPPIDGPDVSLDGAGPVDVARLQRAEATAAGARKLVDRRGRRWVLGNKGRVHQLLAAHGMVKIEKIYGTIFQNILGERVSTAPVVTINGPESTRTAVCLHCESKRAVALIERGRR